MGIISPARMSKFFYTYVLFSLVDNKFYVGWTPDLKSRIMRHNNGLVTSTKLRRPLRLIYYQAFLSKTDSLLMEKYLKSGWGRKYLNKIIKDTMSILADEVQTNLGPPAKNSG
jgi:putative endonuclease